MTEKRKLTSTYQVTVEVLSPVHIGDGSQLLNEIDYVTHNNQTWVVDQEQFLERMIRPDDSIDERLVGRPVSELLTHDDYLDHRLFRYRMPGTPTNRPIKSHIKDVYARPYIPGSTLKGLLRNLFIWGWFVAGDEKPDLRKLGRSRSWAGQPIERDVMGANPNEDVFRAVRVSDTLPVELDRLHVASVNIFPTGGRNRSGVVVDVEALRPETVFETQFTVEEYLFTDPQAEKLLNWQDKRVWIKRLARIGQHHTGIRLAEEIEYFQKHQAPTRILNFYNHLVRRYNDLEKGQFLAQLGWGAGWNSKTLNNLLTEDERAFANLVRDYRLTKNWRNFQPGDEFPVSRHVVQQRDEPVIPMGWVLVKIE